MPSKIHVIGIGDDGLAAMPASVRELITGAAGAAWAPSGRSSLAAGSRRPSGTSFRATSTSSSQLLESAGDKRVVMLVHGDPLFYGLARYVSERLGKDRFVVVPHVSSMQLAFARVMETWEEAYLTNLANHPLDAVLEKIRTAQKVGLFTTDQCGPAEVAKALLARKIDYFTAYVCENLGARDERVTRGTLAEIAAQKFDPLNVMILVRDAERARPAARSGRPPAVRQSGRSVPAVEAASRACSRRPKCGRWRSRRWTSPRRASSGTSAPAAAR